MIVATDGSRTVLFYSHFDDALDDYVDYYACYALPALSADELQGSWVGLENRALDRLPDIPLNELPFELPRRG
jgi:hypothetical protein